MLFVPAGRADAKGDSFCRICPGRYLADQSLFAIVASVLAAFSITLPLDEQGNPVSLKVEMNSGLIR